MPFQANTLFPNLAILRTPFETAHLHHWRSLPSCRRILRWPELQPHFTKVWSMTLRCMDDIKETVRK